MERRPPPDAPDERSLAVPPLVGVPPGRHDRVSSGSSEVDAAGLDETMCGLGALEEVVDDDAVRGAAAGGRTEKRHDSQPSGHSAWALGAYSEHRMG